MLRGNVVLSGILLTLAAAGAVWLRQAPASVGSDATASVALVSPERLEGLTGFEFERGDGVRSAVRRVEGVGWAYASERDGAWPIRMEALQGFLGLLSRARGRVTEASDADSRGVIRLGSNKGDLRLSFVGEVTGGLARVRVEDGDGVSWLLIDSDLASIAQSGAEAWRWGVAAPAPGGRAIEVSLAAGAGAIELARVGAGWRVRSPGSYPASADAVQRVLSAVAESEVRGWDAEAVDDSAAPVAVVDVAWEASDGSNGTIVRSQSVEVFGAGDAEGRTLIVRSSLLEGERYVWGPLWLRVDSAPLAALSTAVEAYLPRRAIDRASSSVVRAEIAGPDGEDLVSVSRRADGWRQDIGDGWTVNASSWTQALEILTAATATGVAIERPTGVGGVIGIVRLAPTAGGESQELTLFVAVGDPSTVIAETGGVWYVYAPGALDVSGWTPPTD